MPAKPLMAALAMTVPTIAACGGSGASTSSKTAAAAHTRPTAIYRVRLSGHGATPPGAPQGQGDAVIAFHGASVLCWRFAHLHGFTGPQSARIQSRATHHSLVALAHGSRLRHQGCVSVRTRVAQVITANPSAYDVTIPSPQYPGGAVRAQL